MFSAFPILHFNCMHFSSFFICLKKNEFLLLDFYTGREYADGDHAMSNIVDWWHGNMWDCSWLW